MTDLREAVRYYVGELERPTSGVWWHNLVELGPDALPLVIDAFHNCRKDAVRRELLTAIWQFRSPSTTSLLGRLLRDTDAEIRKSALDGLVTIATDEALEVLRQEDAAKGPMAGAWIQEAVDQILASRNKSKETG